MCIYIIYIISKIKLRRKEQNWKGKGNLKLMMAILKTFTPSLYRKKYSVKMLNYNVLQLA